MFRLLAELGDNIPETLPARCSQRLRSTLARAIALHEVHFPPADTPPPSSLAFGTPAHRRLIFEELFFLELGLELKRRRMRERQGIAFSTSPAVREAIKQILPFHPTAAQKRVFAEIVADMRRPRPCAGSCKATSAPEKPSSLLKPPSSPSKTATRPPSWPRQKSSPPSITSSPAN